VDEKVLNFTPDPMASTIRKFTTPFRRLRRRKVEIRSVLGGGAPIGRAGSRGPAGRPATLDSNRGPLPLVAPPVCHGLHRTRDHSRRWRHLCVTDGMCVTDDIEPRTTPAGGATCVSRTLSSRGPPPVSPRNWGFPILRLAPLPSPLSTPAASLPPHLRRDRSRKCFAPRENRRFAPLDLISTSSSPPVIIALLFLYTPI